MQTDSAEKYRVLGENVLKKLYFLVIRHIGMGEGWKFYKC